jgi:hypothetical protein
MGGEGAELTAGIDTAIEGAVVAEEALAAAATGCVVSMDTHCIQSALIAPDEGCCRRCSHRRRRESHVRTRRTV